MAAEKYALFVKKMRSSVVPFTVLFALFAALSWYIIRPLAVPLMWSVLFSYFAFPIYRYLYEVRFNYRWKNVAAAVSTGAIMVFIALPLLVLSAFVTKEAIRMSRQLMESGLISGSYSEIIMKVKALPIFGGFVNELDLITDLPIVDALIRDSAKYITVFLTAASSRILESILKLVLIIVIIAVTSFFMVRDGRGIISYVTELLPLREEERRAFVTRTAVMLKAVVCGIIMTAAVQGALGGIGWWYVGLGHPVFFGVCMFVTAMIPFVGTPSVWGPGAALLFLRGDAVGGCLLLAWGLCVVSSIDNFIKPIFISEGSHIHMLVIFIGLFGGLYAWGFLGVFIGPLLLSLAVFVLDVYHTIMNSKEL